MKIGSPSAMNSEPPTNPPEEQPCSYHFALFKHLADEHGLMLLESEMDDIERIVLRNFRQSLTAKQDAKEQES